MKALLTLLFIGATVFWNAPASTAGDTSHAVFVYELPELTGEPGTPHTQPVVDVPAHLVGQSCLVRIVNNESVRPRHETDFTSNVLFFSGTNHVTLMNVERASDVVTEGTIVLQETVFADLWLGEDELQPGGGAYSGSDATFLCNEEPQQPPEPTPTPGTPTDTVPVPAQPVPATPTFTG